MHAKLEDFLLKHQHCWHFVGHGHCHASGSIYGDLLIMLGVWHKLIYNHLGVFLCEFKIDDNIFPSIAMNILLCLPLRCLAFGSLLIPRLCILPGLEQFPIFHRFPWLSPHWTVYIYSNQALCVRRVRAPPSNWNIINAENQFLANALRMKIAAKNDVWLLAKLLIRHLFAMGPARNELAARKMSAFSPKIDRGRDGHQCYKTRIWHYRLHLFVIQCSRLHKRNGTFSPPFTQTTTAPSSQMPMERNKQ